MARDNSKAAYQKAQERNRKAGGTEDVTTLRSFISGNERALLNWLRKSVTLNNQIDEGRARRILDELNQHGGSYDFLSDDDWEFIYDTAKQTRENPEYNEAFRNEHNADFSDGSIDPDARSLLEEDKEALADDYEKYLNDYYSEDNITTRKYDGMYESQYARETGAKPDGQDYLRWLKTNHRDYYDRYKNGQLDEDYDKDGNLIAIPPQDDDATMDGGRIAQATVVDDARKMPKFPTQVASQQESRLERPKPVQPVQEVPAVAEPQQQEGNNKSESEQPLNFDDEPAPELSKPGVKTENVAATPQPASEPAQQTVTAESPVVEQPKVEVVEQPAPQPVETPTAPIIQNTTPENQATSTQPKVQGARRQAVAAGSEYASAIRGGAERAGEARGQIGTQMADYLARVAREQGRANEAAINAAETSYQTINKGGIDRILEMGERVKEAEKEAAADRQAKERAARWTGATELAASLANLFFVGNNNAVSQQYKDFSQDWMRKADANAKEHRQRIDNLRERQRQMQDRLNTLKASNVQSLATLRINAANAQARTVTDAMRRLYDYRRRDVDAAQKSENEAAKAIYNADMAGIKIESGGRKSTSAGRSSKPSTVTKTPQPNDPRKATGDSYRVTFGGKNYVAKMSKQTRKQAMTEGMEEMKKDVCRIAGANSWEELEAGVTGKTGRYKAYYDIVRDINDGNIDAVDVWYSTHRKQCENMGGFLLEVSNGYWEEGAESEATNGQEETVKESAVESGESDDETPQFDDDPAPELKKPKKKSTTDKKDNPAKTSGSWADKYK